LEQDYTSVVLWEVVAMVQSKPRQHWVALHQVGEQMLHTNSDFFTGTILQLIVDFDLLTNQYAFEHSPILDAFE